MAEQLVLFEEPEPRDRILVSTALRFVLGIHLKGKPSARPWNSNRKQLCRNLGNFYYDSLTEMDMAVHIQWRKDRGNGAQTIRHDIGLMVLMDNLLRKWKRKKYIIEGRDFSILRLPEESPFLDIKKPKALKREVIVPPNDFSKWIEHCPERLKWRSFFALFTGLSPIELKRLKPSQYNPYNDCLQVQRGKNQKVENIPVPRICRQFILDAIREGRELLLDWTDHQGDVEKARKVSGVYFWFGRDLRKNFANDIYEFSGYDPRMVSKGLLHTDPRTAVTHYIIESGKELRPYVGKMEEKYL